MPRAAVDAAGRKGGCWCRVTRRLGTHGLPGSLATVVPGELRGGIIWSRSERLGLALLSELKETAALCKAFTCAKNLCYNTLLCYYIYNY